MNVNSWFLLFGGMLFKQLRADWYIAIPSPLQLFGYGLIRILSGFEEMSHENLM